jgi:hypothetical protein
VLDAGGSQTAIRAIFTNPVCDGRSVWGKQRRFEELLDLDDVSAGHVTRMRWRASSEWIEATTPKTKALVDEATLVAVANHIGGGARRERQQDAVHPYLPRGIALSDLCGRKMQGSARRSRIAGAPTRVLHRCEFRARRSVPLGMDHPPTVHVREGAIDPRLDAWLAQMVTPEVLTSAQAIPPDVVSQHMAVRTTMADCDVRIKRLLESTEAASITGWSRHESDTSRPSARGLKQRSASTTSGAVCRPARSASGPIRSEEWLKCSSKRILRTVQLCARSLA